MSSKYIANSSTIIRVFIELNNNFISCIHGASAHELPVSLHRLQVQRCVQDFWNKLEFFFFFERVNKILGSELKFKVGQVSGTTKKFFMAISTYDM
jgi:hypothetical protein